IDDERQRLEHIIATEGGRNRVFPELAARQLRASAHGPAARATLEQLERVGRLNAPLVIQSELGSDPTGWAAVAHLSSPRRAGPFVLRDGASTAERDSARWRDPERSPLSMADGGSLVLFELVALPLEVQELIAQELSQRSA